ARDTRRLVPHGVENLGPQVRHPDLVHIWERQADPGLAGRPVLAHLLVLATHVAGRFLDVGEKVGVGMAGNGGHGSARVYQEVDSRQSTVDSSELAADESTCSGSRISRFGSAATSWWSPSMTLR